MWCIGRAGDVEGFQVASFLQCVQYLQCAYTNIIEGKLYYYQNLVCGHFTHTFEVHVSRETTGIMQNQSVVYTARAYV